MSGASKRANEHFFSANEHVSGPVLTSGFPAVLDHSAWGEGEALTRWKEKRQCWGGGGALTYGKEKHLFCARANISLGRSFNMGKEEQENNERKRRRKSSNKGEGKTLVLRKGKHFVTIVPVVK